MSLYIVRQIDEQGDVLSERRIEATSSDAALRQLNELETATRRINVLTEGEEQVGQMNADFWRQKYRRSRR